MSIRRKCLIHNRLKKNPIDIFYARIRNRKYKKRLNKFRICECILCPKCTKGSMEKSYYLYKSIFECLPFYKCQCKICGYVLNILSDYLWLYRIKTPNWIGVFCLSNCIEDFLLEALGINADALVDCDINLIQLF